METTDINKSIGIPLQKLPYGKKDDSWRQANVDYYISLSSVSCYGKMTRSEKIARDYRLYNGDISKKDFMYVTNPFGLEGDDVMPANLKNINILRTEIDLLIGEETKRPFKYFVYQTSPMVLSEQMKEQDQVTMEILRLWLMLPLMNKYANQNIDEQKKKEILQQREKTLVEALKNHIGHSYKDELEEGANHYLRWFMKKYNMKDIFITTWKDALISAFEVGYIGEKDNKPYPERVNPMYFNFAKNPDLEYIEDSDWCVRRIPMSPASIIDRFGDLLSSKDKDAIMRNDMTGMSKTSASDVNYLDIRKQVLTTDPFIGTEDNCYDVYHVVWSSYAKIGYRTFIDRLTGEKMDDIVDEWYKPVEGDEIRWDWIKQIWEGYRILNNIYAGIRPTDYDKMPYVGVIYNNTNAEPVSMVDIMFPILVTYLIVWYRLELTLARDKGKIITIDITQIPKSQGYDFNKWIYYLSALGINIVNPYEDEMGVERHGKAASFNQFSSIDLSMANVINEYVLLLSKIEDMMGYISGVTKQRLGAVSQYELVSNVERSVIQSSHITEPWFYRHNTFKRNFLTALLERAQQIFDPKDPTFAYIMEDFTKVVWSMPKEFTFADLDIFVTDSSEEHQKINAIRNIAQQSIASGGNMYDAAMMFVNDSVSGIMNKLKEVDEQRKQAERQAGEAARVMEEKKVELENRRLSIEESDSIRRSETDIQIALIERDSENRKKDIDERKLDVMKGKVEEDVKIKREKLNIERQKSNKKE